MTSEQLSVIRLLTGWYAENRRSLPWRDDPQPYKVWISEIILQQTRVDQGLPYYRKFLNQFPDIRSLARVSEEKILRLWQGLGYYSRARNLHACARSIVKDFDGQFPQTAAGLLTLPGIGPYTAAAIASICFGEAVPVIDGNVYRVLSRVFGITDSISSPAGKKIFAQKAADLMKQVAALPEITPGEYNQALMEFGALQCIPRSPDCAVCPLKHKCVAYRQDMQHVLPVKDKPKTRRIRHFHYFIITDGRNIVLRLRGAGDIWHGLYDFPAVEADGPLTAAKVAAHIRRSAGITTKPEQTAYVRHLLSHQEIHGHFFLYKCRSLRGKSADAALKHVSLRKAFDLPKPVFIAKTLKKFGLATVKPGKSRE